MEAVVKDLLEDVATEKTEMDIPALLRVATIQLK
ncbi:hypothetical protein SDC9_97636 [bioreactor metagenome]|uniref:Uncharacterized protein n=1 Tax=bioreactor metagenome TaxID=1076179 RepID=A0A645ACK5_9ZZZZ